MLNIKKEVRDLNRFKTIAFVLGKEGLFHYFPWLDIGTLVRRKTKDGEKITPEVRLRRSLERLGPTFVKLGQILSLRPDLVPKEYVREFSKLQDTVPSFTYPEVEKIILQELHRPVEKIFSSFEKKPLASASISQVHKAKLHSGQAVAVKVQRPNIIRMMETDIEIMFAIAKYLEKHSKKFAQYRPVEIVHEFQEWTERELDFRYEAGNAKKFLKNAHNTRYLKIPKVYEGYSSSKVITLEFMDGVELRNIKKMKNYRRIIKRIIERGFSITLKQVFEDGFFHADPHPANIFVLKDGRVGLVDFGIVGYFDDFLKQRSIEMFYGVVEQDADAIIDAFRKMHLLDSEDTDADQLKKDIQGPLSQLKDKKLRDVKISFILEEVLDIALRHRVRMPIDFVLFGKALVTMEGVGLEYDPNFTLTQVAGPYVESLIKKQIIKDAMGKGMWRDFLRYKKLFSEFPDRVTNALERIQKGTIKIDVEDSDVGRLGLEIDKSSNRLTYGIIIAALLITGALLKDVGEPVYGGFPLISLACFGLAGVFTLGLGVSIYKEGK
ncbi:AarF/ABC1/UbiB kinase family protein [Candidatus Woesearchaeota archaeon]|nr:AarF/ABC1/UbiB kinase family protein [Candidatus Woesearchaeota archaeon]